MKSFLYRNSFLILMFIYFCMTLFIQNYVTIFRFISGQELFFDSRVWHLYVNYFDFGFSKRALLGTLVQTFQLDIIFQNEYFLNLFLTFFTAAFLVVIVTLFVIKNGLLENDKLLFLIFLISPGTLHYFYWAGNVDNFLLIILFSVFLIAKSTLIISGLIFLGLLAHESFMFFVPIILLIQFLKSTEDHLTQKIISLIPLVIAAATSAFVVVFYGSIDMQQEVYFKMMGDKIPLTYEKLLRSGELYSSLWWSGFNEITYSVAEYRNNEGMEIRAFTDNLIYVLPATLLSLYFPFIAAYHSKNQFFIKVLIFFSLSFPLLMAVLANDFWRYTSFVMIISLVFIFKQKAEGQLSYIPKYKIYSFLPFCLLGPYGASDMYAPFHMLYVLIDKIFF